MKKTFLFAAIALSANIACAQDTTNTLDEVVVTANKFPNKTMNTGKVVTVITKEQIAQSGSKDLSQVLSEQAGLYVNGGFSNPGKDKSVYLRGAKVDHTLITIDGVPVYDPSGIGSNFDIRWLSIDNIERIEILKGSQSTLYGSDAIAGVINIITNKTGVNCHNIIGSFQTGSYDTKHANASLSVKSSTWDYSLNATLIKTKGINEATDSTAINTNTDKDAYTQKNFYASIGYRPNEKIAIKPFIRYASFIQNYDQGAFIDELDLTANSTNWQYGLKNEFAIGKGKLMINYNYNKISRTYIDDSTKSRNGYDIYNKGVYAGAEHYADAFMLYPINEHLKITSGLEWRSSLSNQEYMSVGAWSFSSKLSADSLKQHQLSAYMNALIQTQKGFNLEIGGRWNQHSAYGDNFVYNINPSFSINNIKLFANLSTAYKTPSLYQLYSEYGNLGLKPENGMTIEGGAEWNANNLKQQVRVTAFDRKVKDLIFFFYDAATWTSKYINQDRQHDYGVELEMKSRIGKTANFRGYFSYVNGNITTVNNGKDTSYFNLLRRPKWNGGITFNKTFDKRWTTSLSVMAFGERKDLSYDASFNSIEVTLKSYVLINLYAEYKMLNNKLRLFAELRNISNTQYTEVYGFNTPGFNGYGGLRFSL